MTWTAALGRLHESFAVARALYLGEGFRVPDQRFSPEQTRYNVPGVRGTLHLFMPGAEPMRRDRRFAALASDIGLVRYWRSAGRLPDDPAVARIVRA
jgi:hypothetical protein